MTNHTISPEAGQLTLTGHPTALIVTRASQLPEAMKNQKPIIIDNPEIEKRLKSLNRWQQSNFLIVSVIVGALLAFAISREYKLELSWHRDWKINTLDGKITLTPVKRN